MAAEIKFKLDDKEYELPQVDDLTMDEWHVLYETAGLILEDFAPLEDAEAEKERQRRISQPNFTRAMLQIAYQRANPDVKPDAARQIAGEAKLLRVLESMGDNPAEDEADPPEQTIEPSESSPSGSVTSNANASRGFAGNLSEQESQRETTGTPV